MARVWLVSTRKEAPVKNQKKQKQSGQKKALIKKDKPKGLVDLYKAHGVAPKESKFSLSNTCNE